MNVKNNEVIVPQKHSPIHQFSKRAKQITILLEREEHGVHWTLINEKGEHSSYGAAVDEITAWSMAGHGL